MRTRSTRVLRGRAPGRVQAGLAQRRSGRTAPSGRQLLHQGARVVNTSDHRGAHHDGEVRAFHNICRHRGNKLVWDDSRSEETSGMCRQFTCKYHGWRYDLDGALAFVQQEGEFFDLDKSDTASCPCTARCGPGSSSSTSPTNRSSRCSSSSGPMVTDLEGYPFDQMTSRFSYRTDRANWKLFMDAFQEFYHAPIVHSGQSPTPTPRPPRRPASRPRTTGSTVRTASSAPRACGSGSCPTR